MEEIKSSHNAVFSVEGDIFEDCYFDWVQMRKMIIEELYNSLKKLKRFIVMEVPPQVVSEVADRVAKVARMSVKVEWMIKSLARLQRKENITICFKRLWRKRSSS